MNREIKFRAWDGVKMYVPTYLGCHSDLTVSVFDTVKRHEYRSPNPKAILMQYTGLKDKNGKEIYEGDIVKFYDLISGIEKFGTIGFKDAAFTIDYKEESSDLLHLEYPLCQIIGNKFENPELL